MRSSRGGFVVCALLFVSMTVSASSAFANVCASTIYFANGILNTPEDADDNRAALQELVNQRVLELSPAIPCSLVVSISYNPTSNAFLDLFESFVQLSSDPNPAELFWRMARGLVASSALFALAELAATINMELDLGDQVDSYKATIARGSPIVLVGHSQGNLFANEAFVRLGSPLRETFRIVPVATPAGYVAGQSAPYTYTTVFGDFISEWPAALESNISNDFTCVSKSVCHKFDSYLMGWRSGRRIANHVLDLNDPPQAILKIQQSGSTQGIGNGGALTLKVTSGQSATVSFSSSDSVDVDGFFRTGSVTWTVGGLTLINQDDFALPLPVGKYEVTLSVIDDLGAESRSSASVIVEAISTPPPQPPVPSQYSIIDLGALPGVEGTSSAWGINNFGTVVGESRGTKVWSYSGCGGASATMPFVWTAEGGMQPLGPPPLLNLFGSLVEPCGGGARAINDDGTIVGYLDYGFAGNGRPFIWTAAAGMQLIPGVDAPGGATAVNDTGQVVGSVASTAFRWSPSKVELLGLPLQYTAAFAINSRGEVAGTAGIESCGTGRPVLWDSAGQLREIDMTAALSNLPPIFRVCSGQLLGINDQLDAVGSVRFIFESGDAVTVALKYSPTTNSAKRLDESPSGLSGESEASDINNQGLVVGRKDGQAFVWTEQTGFKELGAMLGSLGADWTLSSATALNDKGQVVGAGLHEGRSRAFLMTPKPMSGVFWNVINSPGTDFYGGINEMHWTAQQSGAVVMFSSYAGRQISAAEDSVRFELWNFADGVGYTTPKDCVSAAQDFNAWGIAAVVPAANYFSVFVSGTDCNVIAGQTYGWRTRINGALEIQRVFVMGDYRNGSSVLNGELIVSGVAAP
jgi:uncharacterized membrane protein